MPAVRERSLVSVQSRTAPLIYIRSLLRSSSVQYDHKLQSAYFGGARPGSRSTVHSVHVLSRSSLGRALGVAGGDAEIEIHKRGEISERGTANAVLYLFTYTRVNKGIHSQRMTYMLRHTCTWACTCCIRAHVHAHVPESLYCSASLDLHTVCTSSALVRYNMHMYRRTGGQRGPVPRHRRATP